MLMARVSKDPEVRRAEIMDTAIELFAEKGFDETAVSDIVKKVGVAQGTFYYYFKTKHEIMMAILDRSIQEQMQFILVVSDDPGLSIREKLEMILFEKPRHSEGYNKIVEFLHHESNAWIHQKLIISRTNGSIPFIVKLLEKGNEEGLLDVKYPQETAEFLVTGLNFMLDPGFFQWSAEEYERKRETVKMLVGQLIVGN